MEVARYIYVYPTTDICEVLTTAKDSCAECHLHLLSCQLCSSFSASVLCSSLSARFCVLRSLLGSVSFALRSVLCSLHPFFVLLSKARVKSTKKFRITLRSTLILYRKYAANAYAHFRTLNTRATVLPSSYIRTTSVL